LEVYDESSKMLDPDIAVNGVALRTLRVGGREGIAISVRLDMGNGSAGMGFHIEIIARKQGNRSNSHKYLFSNDALFAMGR